MQYFEDRVKEEAGYIVEHQATVRETAHALHIGKSTVHKDVTDRLRYIHPALYHEVRKILNVNKAERHIRGGKATHDKYAALRGGISDREM